MSIAALVLAGGSGARFGAQKQFETLGGERLIDRSVRVARAVACDVTLVLPAGVDWDGDPVDRVVAGGPNHLASTARGVAAIPAYDTLVITGPSHPLVDAELVRRVIDEMIRAGSQAAAPVAPMVDAPFIRRQDGSLIPARPRPSHTVQYPYACSLNALRSALATPSHEHAEELALIAASGGRIASIPGPVENLHVTRPEDLRLLRQLTGF